MRVLKRRRGFTTNSSSAAEFSTTTAGPTATPQGTPTPAGSPQASYTPLPVGAEITLLPAGTTPTAAPAPTPPSPGLGAAASNALVVGGVALAVGAVVVVERLVRLRRGRRRDES